MIKRILHIGLVLFCSVAALAQEIPVSPGMKITNSTTILSKTYNINAPSDSSQSIIVIEGNNIIVDFNQAILNGNKDQKSPDQFSGVAVMIRNSKHVLIRNLKARGYKVALIARNVDHLIIENCDFSYNFRQRLNSSQEKEDVSDWMSYHQNEKDQWLRYGAAIYLRNCYAPVIRQCKVTGGQNALMMTGCDDGSIYANDFSFNSGIGLGMYRCNNNRVMNNRIIFNVRGYSHGVYNRGQDSAGILVYEQSNNNWFYKNQVTHSGDGFFLWAGQTTMDSGVGGCNNNILFGNDFSYAPTNGIEVTFSKNYISQNYVYECDHGIWGGFSYLTTIRENKFKNNRVGIAIEHGQKNEIFLNEFDSNNEAIKIWANSAPPAWGYVRSRDVSSIGYTIQRNWLRNNKTGFSVSFSDKIDITGNYVKGSPTVLKKDTTVGNLLFDKNDSTVKINPEKDGMSWPDSIVNAGRPLRIPDTTYAGRKNIMITEWGPYDFQSPIVWNTNPTDSSDILKFEILGPKGKWKLVQLKGMQSLSSNSGNVPASITAKKMNSGTTDMLLELEYTGPAFVTAFGDSVASGKSYKFSFKKYFHPINWDVAVYSVDTAIHNPITTGTIFSPLEKKAPLKTDKVNKLDYAWWGGIKIGKDTYPQFATVGEANPEFAPGEYEISVTWDDAVRLFIDEKLVLNEWEPSKYTFDESPNKKIRIKLGGKHHFRVEHVELGGFATLILKIKPLEK